MATYDQVITADRWKTARQKSDDEVWSDDEVFYEERDGFPLREFVLHAIEGELMHPAGVGTMDDFEDGIHGRAGEWAEELTANTVPAPVVESFESEIREAVLDHGRPIYREILTEARSWANATNDWEQYVSDEGSDRPTQWQKVDAFFAGSDLVADVRQYAERKVNSFSVPETK